MAFSQPLKLGISSCPNDTWIFYAMIEKKIPLSFEISLIMEDIENLNHRALGDEMDLIKLSFGAWISMKEKWKLLDSGSALGFRNGPLILSRPGLDPEMKNPLIAIPGKNTTANFLLSWTYPQWTNKKEMLFCEIEDALVSSQADLGLVIHESRFTYHKKGLFLVADLGRLWEQTFHLPLPLGGIFASCNFSSSQMEEISKTIHRSILYANSHPQQTLDFCRRFAVEMEDSVMKNHIDLYVNEYSLSLGETGKKAIEQFLCLADLIRGVN